MDLLKLPTTKVAPDPDNPRVKVDADRQAFKELVASVAAVGVLEPLLVVPIPPDEQTGRGAKRAEYRIVAGHRRHAAATQVGLTEVPCQVATDWSTAQVLEAQLIENLQRQDLNPIEEARTFFRLVELGSTHADLAKRVGRPKTHVVGRIALLGLPAAAQAKVASGELSLGAAAELAAVAGEGDNDLTALCVDRVSASARGEAGWIIAQARKDLEAERAVVAEEASARDAGWEVVSVAKGDTAPPKWRLLYDPHATRVVFDDKAMVARHRREPCHALLVNRSYQRPSTAEMCSDPSRHGPKGDSELKAPRRSDKPAQPGRAENREARATREEYLVAWLRGRAPKPSDVLEVVGDWLLSGHHVSEKDAVVAAQLLRDVEAPKASERPWDWGRSQLAEIAEGGPTDRLRVLMAVWCASYHALNLADDYQGKTMAPWLSYLIERGGYEPTEWERRRLTHLAKVKR